MVKPIYVFGGFGILSIFGSFLTLVTMIALKYWGGTSMIQTPMPVLSAMLFLVGIMSVLMGILAEIMVRTYYESQGRLSYTVRETINF
jgi:dolichol-phosphate mannosyltransferase